MESFPESNPGIEQKTDFESIVEEVDKAKVTVYERLNASNDKEAKAEFLENPTLVHPNNEYGELDEAEVKANFAILSDAKEKLDNSDLSDKQRQLIGLVIDDYKRKNEFLAANLAYNAAKTPEEKSKMAEWHHQANEALYGKVNEDTFYTLLEEKIDKIDVKNLSEEDKEVYDWLMNEIGPLPEKKTERFKPKPETVERFAKLAQDFFGGFLKHIPEDKEKFSSDEAVEIVNEILSSEFGDLDVQFRAVVDFKRQNASTDQERRLLKFPKDTEYSRERLKALIMHELGVHAMRAIPYLDSDLKVFATELPGNEVFDEGVAKCVEQAMKGKYEDSGIDHYINIGLATFKGKNFREVYNTQIALKRLLGEDNNKVIKDVQRCFRGTGEPPNNKDLAYYNGANQVWKYIETHIDDPELFDNLFLSGKINIENLGQERLAYEMRTRGGLS